MEQIKIKKVISLNGKIKEFTNPILNDQYSFEENEEGIKVIGNMNLVGEVLYDNDVKEKIDEAFLIEFYIFNEQIDYTLIKLLSYDIKVDENRLIIKMVFSKEKKVIEKENMDEDIDKIENIDYKNEVLIEDINFEEIERIINDKDAIMFSSLDLNNIEDDVVEIVLDEENKKEDDPVEEKYIEVDLSKYDDNIIENEEKDAIEESDDIKEEKIELVENKTQIDNKRESLFKEEYRKTYFYYRMKETDTIESLSSLYRNNMDSLILDKSKYKKNDIVCIKLKWKKK